MDFYFNFVTVINFLTSVINAIIISICCKKCKDLLAGILTVTMDTLQQKQQVQALRFSDNELSTATNVETATVNSNNVDYFHFSTPWIILIVFLSIFLLLVLYWIFVLLIVPLTRKSSICRYLFPCRKPYGNFLTSAMDIFLDVVHVTLGEQIRVFLTTITAPPCSLSFTGSVCIQNFRLSRKHLLSTLYIDWHKCILHYNDHVITLPSEGTAFSFQPNLLTIFSRTRSLQYSTSCKTYGCFIVNSTCFRFRFYYSFRFTCISTQESSQLPSAPITKFMMKFFP